MTVIYRCGKIKHINTALQEAYMKVLVTGVKGQLGFDVVNELEKRGHTAIGVDVDTMDIQIQNRLKVL